MGLWFLLRSITKSGVIAANPDAGIVRLGFEKRHLRIVLNHEVVKDSLTTASDGKQYLTRNYNLGVIISVGSRIKSKRGTQFRQWATQRLKEHLVKGYTLNEKRLRQSGPNI